MPGEKREKCVIGKKIFRHPGIQLPAEQLMVGTDSVHSPTLSLKKIPAGKCFIWEGKNVKGRESVGGRGVKMHSGKHCYAL